MKVLIAEDEAISRRLLEVSLSQWGHEVVVAQNGSEAWKALQAEDAPRLAILDWMMPELDGVEVCRKLRAVQTPTPTYIILVTTKAGTESVVIGLGAGADDYVTKPFEREELRARVEAGVRVVELQQKLAERVRELEAALAREKQLEGLLPICSYCKRIRDDQNYWQQVEAYISQHAGVQFSHGICPECLERARREMLGSSSPGSSTK